MERKLNVFGFKYDYFIHDFCLIVFQDLCLFLVCSNLFATSEPPKYSNLNSPNLLLWFFLIILYNIFWGFRLKTHAIRVRKGCVISILRPTFDQAKNKILLTKKIRKNLENSNILEIPMSWTSYSFVLFFRLLVSKCFFSLFLTVYLSLVLIEINKMNLILSDVEYIQDLNFRLGIQT